MLRALIVDDEPLAVGRMERILAGARDIEIGHTSIDPRDAYEYAKTNRVDIAFLDISMPEINGLRLSSLLLKLHPSVYLVFVTGYDHYALQAFDKGAQDYLLKPVSADRMEKALDRIRLRHGSGTVKSIDPTPAEQSPVQVMLTEQELKIVRLLAEGMSNKDMAKQLNITAETVKFHLKNVYRKLDVNNRVKVLQRIQELNIRI